MTLVPSRGSVSALAFEVEPAVYDEVLAALDYREKGGYQRIQVTARSPSVGELALSTYVAGPGDPNYAGPAPLSEIASCIAKRVGPSGTNREYLLELALALKNRGIRDRHVEALAELVSS